MSRIVVGLSGGVDSSVAAAMLKEQGHEVIGIYMRNWNDESVTINNECPWVEDSNDALIVAQKLDIPFQTIDLSEVYKQRIVDYMFGEYEKGRTPNPDVLCNREIKFDVFLKTALSLGADYVATGHYCRKTVSNENGKAINHLLAGLDANKDQSYFLCQTNQEQLAHALFPIGHLQKNEVRAIAEKYELITAAKKDSQGLCFVGKVKLPTFLQQKLATKKGKIIAIDAGYYDTMEMPTYSPLYYNEKDGKHIAYHEGAHFYTIGQRKGLNIGGTGLPMFVIGTDTVHNIVYVGLGEDHPGLWRKGLTMRNEEVNWIRKDLQLGMGETRKYEMRIRYRQRLVEGVLIQENEVTKILFDQPQKAVSAGQFAAWYDGEELIGSGVIS